MACSRPGNADAGQLIKQFTAAVASACVAFVVSFVLVKVIDLVMGFVTDGAERDEGLDRTEHGEIGFDFGLATRSRRDNDHGGAASGLIPPNGAADFTVVVEGDPAAI